MLTQAQKAYSYTNTHSGKLLAAGIIGIAIYHWLLWQRDRELALQLRNKHAPLPRLQQAPKVSVLVAAWNEGERIDALVRSFFNLSYLNAELVICAGGSDNTFERACNYAGPRVTVIEQVAGEGKQRALAKCLEHGTGEVIFLTDADCLLTDASFYRTLAPIINEGEDATTGRYAPVVAQRQNSFALMQWYCDHYGRTRYGLSQTYVEGLIGRNAALTRQLLHQTGNFSSEVPIGTDYFLARQIIAIGKRVRYVHDSMIETRYTTRPIAYLRQQSRWLRNIIQYGKRFGATHQVESALGQCLSGTVMILWPFTTPITKQTGLMLWILTMAYGSFTRFRYIRFGELSLGLPVKIIVYGLTPIYLLLDQVMLFYSLVEQFLPALRSKW